mgnify:FL=1
MPIIETHNLSFTYSKGTPFEKKAVNNINISINENEIIGIVGHTGSGKSTLIKLFNALLRPSSGQIYLEGKDIWENPKKIREVRFKVGLVFQYPEHQLFEETVYKDISFGPKNMGLKPKDIDTNVINAVKFIDFPMDLLQNSPFELSGGQKRRAAIAGVIAMDPQVLILDEPSAGLDPKGREYLINQISTYHKKRGNTVIFVSHSMENIAKIADRVLVLDNGNALMFDKPSKVFSNAQKLQQIGLDIPDITKVMIKLRQKGFKLDENIITIDQAFSSIKNLINQKGRGNLNG